MFSSQRYPPSELPPRLANFVKVGVIFTFFIIWTLVGTVWFGETLENANPSVTNRVAAQSDRECLPENNQYWTFIIWLVLVQSSPCILYLTLSRSQCYIWIVVYSW